MSQLSLEQRIQQLEDIESIKKLKARYWFACDNRDTQAIRECFHADDMLIDFGFIGEYRDIDKFIATFEALACHPTHIDMHLGTAPEIDITSPNSASARWRMRFQLLETEKKLVQMMHGYYDDEYIKLGDAWKIKVTRYTIQSNLFMAAEAGNLELMEIGNAPGLVTQDA
ncbi:MAG: nuclear transport factor 2 family protein [Gammaproteobacteria bacterium]|nr:nuclear transport factor 2 family protein [Gammaproteobacteria bacterium]MBT8150597.1 nuclear transport factor 2 family protein [Gammaproteobacteria bacterium]NND38947.1 nuclear transport factor 2 family protein [Pseudomonadales bacterium]NNL10691.1 nuclear transport factor 2 family protein [Pseudomonadales bacterium]NNM11950.1 nuclear transport factor 2 family protein [Pseudomonadales bacterium]